ncbi:MAG TPA: hypothetical protein VIJ96_08595 [Acidothermaceae bacterium]
MDEEQLRAEYEARQQFSAAQRAADDAAEAAEQQQREAAEAEATRIAAVNQMMAQASAPSHDPAQLASANAMLSDFSRTGSETLPQDGEEASDEAPEPDYESAFQPFAQRDLADTASLLRELSSLGFEDEPAPSTPRPAPSQPPSTPTQPRPTAASAAQQKKKRGLFGR